MYLSEDRKVYGNMCMESFAQKEFSLILANAGTMKIRIAFQSPLPIICGRNMQRHEEM
jgi:hypothetical protein